MSVKVLWFLDSRHLELPISTHTHQHFVSTILVWDVFSKFSNFFTICVNLISMEEMDSPSTMWKNSYCWMRVLIFDCLTSSVSSRRVSNPSHIALVVLQWERKSYSFTPKEEMSIFRVFKSYWTFFLSSSLQSTFGLSCATPLATTCG